jgi:hypothetical protein
MLGTVTSEVVTRRLGHEKGEARAFYASWAEPAWVGIEGTTRERASAISLS